MNPVEVSVMIAISIKPTGLRKSAVYYSDGSVVECTKEHAENLLEMMVEQGKYIKRNGLVVE